MIYDKLNRLPQYKGLSATLDKLIDWVLAADLPALSEGREEIEPDRAWVNYSTCTLNDQPLMYERHRTCLDLHLALTGGETIYVQPAEAIPWPDWAQDEETQLAPGRDGIALTMEAGTFAILFPGDAHCPSHGRGICRKLVGKAVWPG